MSRWFVLCLVLAACKGEVDGDQGPDVDDDGDGLSENEGDCDDANAAVFPGALELCDGVVNDCDGSASEAGLISADGANYDTLEAALAAVSDGGTVGLCGTEYSLDSTLVLDRDLTLWSPLGAQTTRLVPTHSDSVLRVDAAAVTLRGLSWSDGGSAVGSVLGGAVHVTSGSSLTLDGCILDGHAASHGGAIYADDASLRLVDTTVNGRADLDGGVVRLEGGRLTCEGATTLSGTASAGGAVHIASAEVSGCDLIGTDGLSTAVFGGCGALVDTTWTGGSAVGCEAWGTGGGLWMQGGSLSGAVITDNVAPNGGGLMVVEGDPVTATGLTLRANRGDSGGGAYAAADVDWGDSHFDANTATMEGGGAYMESGTSHQFNGAQFTDNSADNEAGQLFVASAVTVQARSTTFAGGRAPLAGGLIMYFDSRVTLDGGSLNDHVAEAEGGAVRLVGGTLVSNEVAWGTEVPNSDDITIRAIDDSWARAVLTYGAVATFECTLDGCTPEP